MIQLPIDCNYIAVFLTLRCSLHCPYCINKLTGITIHNELSSDDWLKIIAKIPTRPDLPITLQGGEPTQYTNFYKLINSIPNTVYLDLLTNLEVNIDEFIDKVPVNRFNRPAPYSSIRVSYHRSQMDYSKLIVKVLKLLKKGYNIGIWALDTPEDIGHNNIVERVANLVGIDFRYKELLGRFKGVTYGKYKYPDAVNHSPGKKCLCRTSELLISPSGDIHRCHGDLYTAKNSISNMLDDNLPIIDIYRPCNLYGNCNPCDVKLKTNRFQVFGHCSVDIKDVKSQET